MFQVISAPNLQALAGRMAPCTFLFMAAAGIDGRLVLVTFRLPVVGSSPSGGILLVPDRVSDAISLISMLSSIVFIFLRIGLSCGPCGQKTLRPPPPCCCSPPRRCPPPPCCCRHYECSYINQNFKTPQRNSK